MSGVFQNIDPPPLTARRVCTPPRLLCGGRTHSLGGEGGGGVNILEDARHSYVLYVCKYFVGPTRLALVNLCYSSSVTTTETKLLISSAGSLFLHLFHKLDFSHSSKLSQYCPSPTATTLVRSQILHILKVCT
jgi:hypothetical protein